MTPASTVADLRSALATIRRCVRTAQPSRVTGEQARAAVDLFAEMERLGASGVALFAPRVAETGSYAKAGHGSAADWLSAVSGSSTGSAKGRLAAAGQAATMPELTDALRAGSLSSDQLKLVADAERSAPGAAQSLLPMVDDQASMAELRDQASRLRTAARCRETERARRNRVHSARHFRWSLAEGGGIRSEMLCDEAAFARVLPIIEASAQERWRSAAGSEPLEAHRLDAVLALLTHGLPGSGARPHTYVVIDAEALRRGATRGGELCEIEGIGPVSVDVAVDLIGEGAVQYLVRDGVDIRTVTSTSRHIPQRVAAALTVRDRCCAVPGCGKRLGLESDHCVVDVADDGPTEIENLARLCSQHHALKTYGGWRLTGRPGRWGWKAPANPPSAGFIVRARRLAATKATHNRPRRT
jgi:hypothetical protein